MARRIVFREKQHVDVEDFDPGTVTDGTVRVESLYSLMSTGTENIAFNRLFSPGTHWDGWVSYPFYPGYATVGRVDEVGPGEESLTPGQRVCVGLPHASTNVVPAALCHPVPEGIDPKHAVWSALAAIGFVAARNAEYQLGDSALVVGAGPIGQMSVRWARAAGVHRVIVVDPMSNRLELARRGGATATISGSVGESVERIRNANGGELPRVVIEATGHAGVFADALRAVGYRGRLVLVGDTGSPEAQHLTSDVLTRGITIVGTHAMHLGHVLGIVRGDPFASGNFMTALGAASARFNDVFFSLLAGGQFDVDGLISHEFGPDECAKAYALANERREETVGILFDWT